MTKVYAKEILDVWKRESAVFSSGYSGTLLETQLQSAGFSQADAICIAMALKLAGSNIKY